MLVLLVMRQNEINLEVGIPKEAKGSFNVKESKRRGTHSKENEKGQWQVRK